MRVSASCIEPAPYSVQTFLTCLCLWSAEFATDSTHVPVTCAVYCHGVCHRDAHVTKLEWADLAGRFLQTGKVTRGIGHGSQRVWLWFWGLSVCCLVYHDLHQQLISVLGFFSSRELTLRNRAGMASREEAQPD